jgi:tRNA modification GTPase
VQVLDTAGIRETSDQVEIIGVERSHRAAKQADLILLTIDASTGWTKADAAIYQQVQHRPLILVINKIDLAPNSNPSYPNTIKHIIKAAAALNQGIDNLEKAILETHTS